MFYTSVQDYSKPWLSAYRRRDKCLNNPRSPSKQVIYMVKLLITFKETPSRRLADSTPKLNNRYLPSGQINIS